MSEYDNQGAPNIDEDVRESEVMRKLFVGGINRETSDEVFFDYFSTYGELVDKVVIHDTNTKASKGFGFITFDKAECVENIFAARPHLLDGKTLDVKRAMPKNLNNSASHFQTTKLFIGGISEELTPEDLQNYIESRHSTSYGTVEKIDFLKERDTNKNKGFGFLECSSPDFADRLVICEASFQLNGKKMSLKKAEPKDGGNRGRGRGVGGGQRGRGRGRGYQNDYSQQANGYYNNFNQGYGQGYNSYPAGSNMGGYAQSGSYGSQSSYGGGQQQGWGQRFAPY